jgi:hypothetical protein
MRTNNLHVISGMSRSKGHNKLVRRVSDELDCTYVWPQGLAVSSWQNVHSWRIHGSSCSRDRPRADGSGRRRVYTQHTEIGKSGHWLVDLRQHCRMFCAVLRCWHSPLGIVVYSTSAIYRRELYAGRQGRSNTAQDRTSIWSRRRVAFYFSGPMTHGEPGREVRDLLLEHRVLLVQTGLLYPPLRSPGPYQSSTVISIVSGNRHAVPTLSGSESGKTCENPVSKALGKTPRRVFARCAAIVSTIRTQHKLVDQDARN